MDNEPYHDLTHLQLIATISDWHRSKGCRVVNEHRLPSGAIADVVAVHPGGAVHIIECKLFVTTALIRSAYRKYYDWCHCLWVAANGQIPSRRFNDPVDLPPETWLGRVGLFEVGYMHVNLVKAACAKTLSPDTLAELQRTLPTS